MPHPTARGHAAPAAETVLLMQFSSLDLAQPILDVLTTEGYTTPTPIQAQSIPSILQGRDLLGCAQTGTGKTAAFALPIIHRLLEGKPGRSAKGKPVARVLVLSPTRELATQIADSFKTYGQRTKISGTVIFGGVSQKHQVRDLRRGIDVIVATPGRLMDLMEQGHVDLSGIETFVLDEADRMLDMGFIQPIRRISAALPAERQTLLFSATMPKAIAHLADDLLESPARVTIKPAKATMPKIEQSLYMVEAFEKVPLLGHLLECRTVERAVVFTRTKHGADKLTKTLTQRGVSAGSIHGNKSQNQRQRALDSFRDGRSRVLVATDVAARGLDVDGVTHVFNFNLPNEPEAYVHRIGRTGRAGATGIAVSFCDRTERKFLRDIERLTGKRMPTSEFPEDLEMPEGTGANGPRPTRMADSPPRHDHPKRNRAAGRPGPSGAPNRPRKPKAKTAAKRSGAVRPEHESSQPSARPNNARPKKKAHRGQGGPGGATTNKTGKPAARNGRARPAGKPGGKPGARPARGSGAGRGARKNSLR